MLLKFNKFLKKFYNQFLLHHARYRIFTLIVCAFVAAGMSYEGGFWDRAFTFLLVLLVTSALILYFLDKQIRTDMRFLVNPWIGTPSKASEVKDNSFTQEDFFSIVKFIKEISIQCTQYLRARIINILTRFPFFEHYGLNTSSHYRYRHIRQLLDYLEHKNHQIIIEKVSLDGYFCTLNIFSNKDLTTNKFQIKTKNDLKSYLKRDVDSIIIRPHKHTAQLLIPIEYLMS